MAEYTIDKIEYNGNVYKLQDGISGYITGYTETDPKFVASPAYGITANDITNWNGKVNKSGDTMTGDLTLYVASGNSPGIIFQRGTLTDNYNDWKIYDKGGYLYFAQRGSGSSSFGDIGYIDTGGVLRNFTIPWGSVTGKPTIPEGISPYTGTTSAVSTTASNGTSNEFARGDHVHNLTLGTLDSTLVYNLGVIYPNNMVFEVSSAAFNAIQAMWDTGFCIIRADINSDAVVYAIKERLISYNDTALYAFVGVEASMGNQGLETGKHLFGISSSGFGLYAYVSDWNQDDTETVFNTQLAHLNISSSTTGITASTDATKTTLGTASSIYGVQSSTTTASKVTLSGSNSFSASVSNHVLSFSHGAQTVSASDVTVPIKDTSAKSIPSVSVTSATVSITDPGHTHQLSN